MAELVGLTASIIGIASAGVKLSTTLYTFAESASRADQDITDIAGDVALTANVLDSVGNVLKEDDTKSLASKAALNDAENILKRCEAVFGEIRQIVDKRTKIGKDGKKMITTLGRLAWPLKEQRVELMRRRLDSLKTSLLLLLKVLSFAGDRARGKEASLLLEERENIRALHKRHQQSLENLNMLEKRLDKISLDDSETLCGSTSPSRTSTFNLTAHPLSTDVDVLKKKPSHSKEVTPEPLSEDSDDTIGGSDSGGDDGTISAEDLVNCTKHVQKLLRRIESLQNLVSEVTPARRSKRRVHKAYRRFCLKIENEVLRVPVIQHKLDSPQMGKGTLPSIDSLFAQSEQPYQLRKDKASSTSVSPAATTHEARSVSDSYFGPLDSPAQSQPMTHQQRAALLPPQLPPQAVIHLMSLNENQFCSFVSKIVSVNQHNNAPLPNNPQMGQNFTPTLNAANLNAQQQMRLAQQNLGAIAMQSVPLLQQQQQQASYQQLQQKARYQRQEASYQRHPIPDAKDLASSHDDKGNPVSSISDSRLSDRHPWSQEVVHSPSSRVPGGESIPAPNNRNDRPPAPPTNGKPPFQLRIESSKGSLHYLHQPQVGPNTLQVPPKKKQKADALSDKTSIPELAVSHGGGFCMYCGQSFTRQEHLERHILTHTNFKSFVCFTCQMTFNRRDLLHRHYTVHGQKASEQRGVPKSAGRTPLACSNCAKAYIKCDRKFPCSRCESRNLRCTLRPTRRASKNAIKSETAPGKSAVVYDSLLQPPGLRESQPESRFGTSLLQLSNPREWKSEAHSEIDIGSATPPLAIPFTHSHSHCFCRNDVEGKDILESFDFDSFLHNDMEGKDDLIDFDFDSFLHCDDANSFSSRPDEHSAPNTSAVDKPPWFINPKQFHRILKRRLERQKFEEQLEDSSEVETGGKAMSRSSGLSSTLGHKTTGSPGNASTDPQTQQNMQSRARALHEYQMKLIRGGLQENRNRLKMVRLEGAQAVNFSQSIGHESGSPKAPPSLPYAFTTIKEVPYPSQKSPIWPVPVFNLIHPTPTGSVRAPSAPPSPVVVPQDATPKEYQGSTRRQPKPLTKVTLREDQTHYSEVETPGSYRENFIADCDAKQDESKASDQEIVIEEDSPRSGKQSITSKPDSAVPFVSPEMVHSSDLNQQDGKASFGDPAIQNYSPQGEQRIVPDGHILRGGSLPPLHHEPFESLQTQVFSRSSQFTFQYSRTGYSKPPSVSGAAHPSTYINGCENQPLQDYQMQLKLLEHQNKKRLLMARNEEKTPTQGLLTEQSRLPPTTQSHGNDVSFLQADHSTYGSQLQSSPVNLISTSQALMSTTLSMDGASNFMAMSAPMDLNQMGQLTAPSQMADFQQELVNYSVNNDMTSTDLVASASPTETWLELRSLSGSDRSTVDIAGHRHSDFKDENTSGMAIFNPSQILHIRTNSGSSQTSDVPRSVHSFSSYEEIQFPKNSPQLQHSDVPRSAHSSSSLNQDIPMAIASNIQRDQRPLRRKRGRAKGLTAVARNDAAVMRVMGTCSNCKRRKEKCDPSTPCKSCIDHYKGDLVNHPCQRQPPSSGSSRGPSRVGTLEGDQSPDLDMTDAATSPGTAGDPDLASHRKDRGSLESPVPFQCSFCPRRFGHVDGLRNHLSVHTHLAPDEQEVPKESAKKRNTGGVELLDEDPGDYAKLTKKARSKKRTISGFNGGGDSYSSRHVRKELHTVKDAAQGVLGPVSDNSCGTTGQASGIFKKRRYDEDEQEIDDDEDIVDVLLNKWTVLPQDRRKT